MFFVVMLLISNLVAPKLISFGSFDLTGSALLAPLRALFGDRFQPTLSGAQLLFPLTYIFADFFTEVYGYAGSRRAIWMGFLAQALLTIVAMIIVKLPAAPGWNGQAAYEYVFGFLPRLVIASLVAYWVGEFANSFVMAKLKVMTKGRHLWMRFIGSTAVGQAIDTLLVLTIAFGGTIPMATLGELMVSSYVWKVVYEALATPMTYAVVNFLKRVEGVDAFDEHTNFSPFAA